MPDVTFDRMPVGVATSFPGYERPDTRQSRDNGMALVVEFATDLIAQVERPTRDNVSLLHRGGNARTPASEPIQDSHLREPMCSDCGSEGCSLMMTRLAVWRIASRLRSAACSPAVPPRGSASVVGKMESFLADCRSSRAHRPETGAEASRWLIFGAQGSGRSRLQRSSWRSDSNHRWWRPLPSRSRPATMARSTRASSCLDSPARLPCSTSTPSERRSTTGSPVSKPRRARPRSTCRLGSTPCSRASPRQAGTSIRFPASQ